MDFHGKLINQSELKVSLLWLKEFGIWTTFGLLILVGSKNLPPHSRPWKQQQSDLKVYFLLLTCSVLFTTHTHIFICTSEDLRFYVRSQTIIAIWRHSWTSIKFKRSKASQLGPRSTTVPSDTQLTPTHTEIMITKNDYKIHHQHPQKKKPLTAWKCEFQEQKAESEWHYQRVECFDVLFRATCSYMTVYDVWV